MMMKINNIFQKKEDSGEVKEVKMEKMSLTVTVEVMCML